MLLCSEESGTRSSCMQSAFAESWLWLGCRLWPEVCGSVWVHLRQGTVVAGRRQGMLHLIPWLAEALAGSIPGCIAATIAANSRGWLQACKVCLRWLGLHAAAQPQRRSQRSEGAACPFAAPAHAAECPWQPAAGSPAPVTLPAPDRAYVIPPYSAGTSETTGGNIIQTADVVFSLTGPDAVPFQTDRQTLFADQLRLLLGNYNFMSVALSDYQVCVSMEVLGLGCGIVPWAGGSCLLWPCLTAWRDSN